MNNAMVALESKERGGKEWRHQAAFISSHGLLRGEVGNPFGVSQMRFLAAWIYLRKA